MANNGLLFISNAAKAHNVCVKASQFIRKVLYVNIKESPEATLPVISRQIVNVYSKVILCQLMLKPSSKESKIETHHPIDVVLYDSELSQEANQLKQSVVTVQTPSEDTSAPSAAVKTYEYVALGGTFDRLHNGHKILLSEAVLRATKHVTVGVTDVNMIRAVKTYEYVALGGTFDRLHNGHKILLSEAVLRATKHVTVGVTDVNMIRAKKLWELIEPVEQRIKEVLNFLKDINPDLEYNPNPNIPDWPYVIGLAGGIASGKSSIAPGRPLNQTISDTFGERVLNSAGEVDRKTLGQIVFSNKSKLEQLNSIIWPAILEEAKNRVRALGSEHRVVVMEAAVMVRATWYHHCHQLWTVIIPPEERNNLTEEESRQRIGAQPSNAEQIAPANIVFSPYWSYEYTQAQIDRAWAHLQELLEARKQ
ncbi:Bifunctional coenzyme A synthase [Operophtera brumata]|uniref:Bifunctional coenzyme A synthase n=1 Tax=Operophtera brumata TaxID=104452 RepID=A0A0L7KX66_OPEBR|nr:Bifunctional coenzyme A synthase [Operophtera brumata]